MKKTILILIALVSLASCRKESPEIMNPRNDTIFTFSALFESFWNGMNSSYTFWSVDPTDWDAVYEEYQPKFAALDEREDEDMVAALEEVEKMFREMTKDLVDGHYNLNVTMYGMCNISISPASERCKERDYYHSMQDFLLGWPAVRNSLLESGRLTDYKQGYVGEEAHKEILQDFYVLGTGLLDKNIVYFRLSAFDIGAHVRDETDPVVEALENYYTLLDNTEDLSGVIIDVRGNGGGRVADMKYILGKFTPGGQPFMEMRMKNGPGRLDYGPWVPQHIPSFLYEKEYDVPIVILADINSVSMSEMSVYAVQNLPNGIFIGERTFGGHGTVSPSNDQFYTAEGGYFAVEGVYFTYTTMTMTRSMNGEVYEGVGIPPDIEVLHDADRYAFGEDNQLERAIEYIKTGN